MPRILIIAAKKNAKKVTKLLFPEFCDQFNYECILLCDADVRSMFCKVTSFSRKIYFSVILQVVC